MAPLFALILLALSPAAPARAGLTVRARLVADPKTLDWTLAHTSMDTNVAMNIMEGLVCLGAKLEVEPCLASSWSLSADRLAYTFRLREGVKWSDGKPLTSADFIASWKRLLDPLTASSYAGLLDAVSGAEDYRLGKNADFSKVGLSAPDPRTLEVRLRSPSPSFLMKLSFWPTFPLRQDIVERFGVQWSRPEHIVVLGPFIPVSQRPGVELILKKNAGYYRGSPGPDSVILRVVNDDAEAIRQFRAGQLDLVSNISALELGELAKSPARHEVPYLRTCLLQFNTRRFPLNLAKTRQAIAMAIDRSRFPAVLHRNVSPADSLVDPRILPEGRGAAPSLDRDRARSLLAASGGITSTAPSLELCAYSTDQQALATQELREQLERELKLKINVRLPAYNEYWTEYGLQSADLFFWCWAADYPDPMSYLDVFLSESSNNKTGWKNATYDELVSKADRLEAAAGRNQVFRQALEVLLREGAPVVPLYHDDIEYLLNPKLEGLAVTPLNFTFFRGVRPKP